MIRLRAPGDIRQSMNRMSMRGKSFIGHPTNHERLRFESVSMQMCKAILPTSLGIVNEDRADGK